MNGVDEGKNPAQGLKPRVYDGRSDTADKAAEKVGKTDDNNKGLRRWPKGQLYPIHHFSATCEVVPFQTAFMR